MLEPHMLSNWGIGDLFCLHLEGSEVIGPWLQEGLLKVMTHFLSECRGLTFSLRKLLTVWGQIHIFPLAAQERVVVSNNFPLKNEKKFLTMFSEFVRNTFRSREQKSVSALTSMSKKVQKTMNSEFL